MKQRLADYVADFLAGRGVTDVFSVVGGGAMGKRQASGSATPSGCARMNSSAPPPGVRSRSARLTMKKSLSR